MDFIAPLVPVGLALGRLGNFIGQELWGRAADVPWAMVFPRDPLQLARHPSQLYQFALEGMLLFALCCGFLPPQADPGRLPGCFPWVMVACALSRSFSASRMRISGFRRWAG